MVGCSCFVFFVFVVFCFVFFGGFGFKGQVRWPKGPPHLALNPPYFLFCFSPFFFGGGGGVVFCFSFFLFLEGLSVRRGGPKGHLTLP